MGKEIKIAATCRKCGILPENSDVPAVDTTVIKYMNEVLEMVRPQTPDLVVLPEMCDLPEGWSMEGYVHYVSVRTDTVVEYIRKKARELNVWIAYSTVRLLDDGTLRNSCLLIDRKGETALIYDKMYPTLGELEVGIFPGDTPKVLECELGRVGAVICFDLNYTELALEYQKKGANLILFPSLFSGGLLQQIWAFTVRAYLVGACGGCSASVVSPAGEILKRSTGYFPEIVSAINLDYALVHLDFNWDKLMNLTDKYADSIAMRDPDGLGSVLLINNSESSNMKEILDDFAVESMDEYLQRMAWAKDRKGSER